MSKTKPAIETQATASVTTNAPSIQIVDAAGRPVQSRHDFDPLTHSVRIETAHLFCDPSSHRMVSNSIWKLIIPILNAQPYEKVVNIFDALDQPVE